MKTIIILLVIGLIAAVIYLAIQLLKAISPEAMKIFKKDHQFERELEIKKHKDETAS